MFDKILVANRGEVAARVMRTARAMGVRSVAVYSDADRNAMHVALADEAVALGGLRASGSYLRGDAIIAAARATGAQAIHPGYGFLSENPEFVDAVTAAGLVFVGPSAEAIRSMGLKDAAKALMASAGVPVVPGYHGADQDPDLLAQEAAKIGFPLLIKAVAGGGGKGMRRVDRAEAFGDALASARAEAQGAFGNDGVLLERFIAHPRHVELQVFGDGKHAVNLFERDCSLQRRHQKVVEEAPAPDMPDAVRAAMGSAAVRAAHAIGYSGAGTIEFIADASDGLREDRFWFMEMNTRLQVEHPVTEEITGIDLVEWQLRVAAGEPLPRRQQDISMAGHAIEVRLYAEDVPAGFLPATGTATHLSFPGDVRVETGLRSGDVVSPHYDPMIAKMIASGRSRDQALRRMDRALARTEIAGLTTNHAFLRRLIAQPDFVSGRVDTGLIERHLDTLAPDPVPCTKSRALAAIGYLGLDQPQAHEGFSLWQPMAQVAHLFWKSEPVLVRVTTLGAGRFTAEVDGATHEVQRGDHWQVDGTRTNARLCRNIDGVSVFWGNGYHFAAHDPLDIEPDRAGAGDAVLAPMPGLVTSVRVAPGGAVVKGDALLTLEAMKMEHALTAPRDGTIAEVLVIDGAQVSAGDTLITLEEDGS